MTSVDRRLRRSASALKDGVAILEWLQESEQRDALVKAAEAGLPSVAGISSALLTRFGGRATTMIIKQFVGRAVKHIMRDAGYEAADTGIKLPDDPVFSSGTRYSNREEAVHRNEKSPLLGRFVAMLTPAELRELRELVATGVC
jgi:hypothetical protein